MPERHAPDRFVTRAEVPHRVALYFAPAPESALAADAAAWLGRDPWATHVSPPEPAGPDDVVAAPRRYGFHATLKAPFRLAEGRTLDDLTHALDRLAKKIPAVEIPAARLGRLGPFFALVEAEPAPALAALAEALVIAFEPFRAPLSQEELAKRHRAGLTPEEEDYLARYGYPYVLDAFRFHMTLTGPVPDGGRQAMDARLRDRFAAHLGRPLAIDAVTVFVEPAPGEPFRAVSRHPLRGMPGDAASP